MAYILITSEWTASVQGCIVLSNHIDPLVHAVCFVHKSTYAYEEAFCINF
jgi:hypothetical protein